MFQRLIPGTANCRGWAIRSQHAQNQQQETADSLPLCVGSMNLRIRNTPLALRVEIPNQIQRSTQAIDE